METKIQSDKSEIIETSENMFLDVERHENSIEIKNQKSRTLVIRVYSTDGLIVHFENTNLPNVTLDFDGFGDGKYHYIIKSNSHIIKGVIETLPTNHIASH